MFVRRTLQLARQLKDRAVEAQACYSLGNTYTLLQDYERAIDYHLKHLIIAQDLNDRYPLATSMPISPRSPNRDPILVHGMKCGFVQDWGGPCMLESWKCPHCTGEP